MNKFYFFASKLKYNIYFNYIIKYKNSQHKNIKFVVEGKK